MAKEYTYSEKEKRQIALVFDYKMRQEYIMLIDQVGDEYGEFPGNEWYDYLDSTYYDLGEYEYIGKNQISNMGYYIDNYFLIPVRPDDITPKIVKTVSDDSISEFYDYCNENNITMDDLIKYLVRQFSYVDDEPFEENDLESISEMIEEDLEPLGFKFSQKLIKGVMMPAYEKMAELE